MPDSEVRYEPIRHAFQEWVDSRSAKQTPLAHNKPVVPGWHSEEESARILGEHLQTRRRNRQRRIGPKEWVRHGRDVLYRDGCEERYLAELLEKAEAERESPRRGRRRSR